MAFLDNLVSDLIKNSTGINARGFVRMVGGKNILLLGGAAVAGALAAEKAGSHRSTPPPVPGSPSSAHPPPAPDTHSQAAPPLPPPPLPTTAAAPAPATPAVEELPGELLWAIVRTMVAAALADGQLAPKEKELIHKRLGESGLDEDQIAQIHRDLVIPPSHHELASLISDPQDGELLYRFGALVTLADRDVSDLEEKWLEGMAGALTISPQRRKELEKEIFVK